MTSFLDSARRWFIERATANEQLCDVSDAVADGDNAVFYAEVARRTRALAASPVGEGLFDPGGVGCVVLMGEYGVHGYGIREAQCMLRIDGTPSYWNHCFLVADALSEDATRNRDRHDSPWIWESTVEPPLPSNDFTHRNGVGSRRLHDYTRAEFSLTELHSIPNICAFAVGMTASERKSVIDRGTDPEVATMRYDISGLLGTWVSYLRDRESLPNPLSKRNAVYCSAYIQLAFEAAGINLAPSADLHNTAPEHLWQMAKWLKAHLPKVRIGGEVRERPLVGWYCIRDKACRVTPEPPPMGRGMSDVAL